MVSLMSREIAHSETLYLQRFCRACGVFSGEIDGLWSTGLAEAEVKLDQSRKKIRDELGKFDPRTERNIATLILSAQRLAREFMNVALNSPHDVRIISGSRTYAEQDALYAIGRTVRVTDGVVTNAQGGESNHNFGLAWDIGIFASDGRYMNGRKDGDHSAYQLIGAMTKSIDKLEWGGNWKSFKDQPHYQLGVKTKSIRDTQEGFERGDIVIA